MNFFIRIKKYLPLKLTQFLRRLQQRYLGFENKYSNLDIGNIFDNIYEEAIWGRDEMGNGTSGSGSHAKTVIDPYVASVFRKIEVIKPRVIVDLGCGDFNVGKNFVEFCERYIACDVSESILNRNRNKFHLKNVNFLKLDISSDNLPKGDLAIVREVLQHLSNNQINRFVNFLNSFHPYKFMILTEAIPSNRDFLINLDKPTGASSRIPLGGGIVLHDPPFNLRFIKKEVICEVQSGIDKRDGTLKTTLYSF